MFKAGFSGRTDSTPEEIGLRIEEYLKINTGILIKNISVVDDNQLNGYSKHFRSRNILEENTLG